MPTPFSKVFERFQQKIQDYTIDEIYTLSIDSYEDYLTGFLKSSVVKFFHCANDLTNRNDTAKFFAADLSELEQEILAHLMLIEWLEKETNNIVEMRLALSSDDWKRYAESQNLKEKSLLKDKSTETADHLKMQYYLLKMSGN
ncbi:hypothetical protein NV379_02620 [Paenibacillus sp. N1-5-1-14]|uniref:hypothetical protein n=1 Tax=Paenibacillus radicibacter TaxID=2972488 RepID=UPI0021598549|nr:hypothetical protein [Paenibacillus radicibacter]MCR8641540.1 hypothetical protein [Paenibacillus radicibacter]